MATFAPPVHRDKFLYSSILYADAGNDNHHPRASVAALTALLRPEVVNSKAKKTKTQTKTQCPEGDGEVKDRPWHFWTAQLLHYGLTATKDKNAAKVRLLSALNGERLEVPGWIQRLEGELKKEWEAENRKLKKVAKGDGVPKLGKSGELDGSKNVSTKKPSTNTLAVSAKAKSTTSKRKRDGVSPLESSKKAKVKSASKDMVSSPLTKKNSAKPPASQKPPPPEEEPWPASYRKAVAHDAWKFYDVDHLAHTRPSNAPHPRPYRVSCPDAEREWEQKTIPEFYLAFSATEDEWWSRFKWGAFEGILILQRQPKRVNKAIGVPFKWRANYAFGNEDGDGEGKIFFDSASTIRGEFHNFFREKPCHFRAEAIQSAPQPQISQGTPVLDQMRIEWSQMPTTMHDAPTKKSARVKKENILQTPSSPAAAQPDVYLSGTYNITAPRIEDTFPIPPTSLPLRLTLFTDEATGIWWASFHWFCLDGVMKIEPGPTYDTMTQAHSLGWRIRNSETGALSFGRDCTGEIRFDGVERTVVGALGGVPGVGRVEFGGRRMAGPRRVGGLKGEWDWFVSEAYGR